MRQRGSGRTAAREQLLVVAAKAPRAGAVKTRLSPPGGDASLTLVPLAQAFLTDTLRKACESPALRGTTDVALALDGDPADVAPLVPAGLSPAWPQSGNSLGERLVHIFERAFGAGYRRVAIIGSDTPHLPPGFVAEGLGRLRGPVDVVLGPADDGGYYLIALSEPRPTLFADIAWSGPDVLSATRAQAHAANLRVALLPPWYDIDTPADLARLHTDLRRGVADAPATTILLEKNREP